MYRETNLIRFQFPQLKANCYQFFFFFRFQYLYGYLLDLLINIYFYFRWYINILYYFYLDYYLLQKIYHQFILKNISANGSSLAIIY